MENFVGNVTAQRKLARKFFYWGKLLHEKKEEIFICLGREHRKEEAHCGLKIFLY